MLHPEVSPIYREDVRKLIVSANDQQDSGRKYVEFPCADGASEPVSEFRTMVYLRMAFSWLSPEGLVASLAIARTGKD